MKNVEIIGNCDIGKNVRFEGYCRLENCKIGDNCEISNSIITESRVGTNCKIGPYVNIRPNCDIANCVKVGAFVELKNCEIGEETKVPHFAYIGDAVIGKKCNIGCGVVFANYDGEKKSKSIIGDEVFIGANVNIVSPVEIGNFCYICAGTTVTKNCEEGDFVIGRVRQENKKDEKRRYTK